MVSCWWKAQREGEERGFGGWGGRQHVSAWLPCGRNPLTWTDKDLINTRLCNYPIIKVICPLVWMEPARCHVCLFLKWTRASEAQWARLPPCTSEFNAPLSHVASWKKERKKKISVSASARLVFICLLVDNSFVMHWESKKLSRLSTKYHQEPHETVNRPWYNHNPLQTALHTAWIV